MNFINPLKKRYPIVVRITALIGIGLVISNFLFFPRFGNSIEFENVEQIIIENIALSSDEKVVNFNQFNESSSSTINNINQESKYFKRKFN